jgi:hypothetical protein
MVRKPRVVPKPLSEADLANTPFLNAYWAVTCLTSAWQHVLRIDPAERGDAVAQIELALESAVRLRERLKSPK